MCLGILIDYFSPSVITILRLAMIVLFLLSLRLFITDKQKVIDKKDIVLIGLLGVVGVFINQWSFFAGLQTADPTTAALVLAMTAILNGFLAAIFLKEKITVRMIFGSIMAIAGIFYVVINGSLASVKADKGIG